MNNIDKFLDISLLIPCYNSEKTLDRLFNSVIKQKYPLRYLKIITINDGSSDNTLGKLQEWQTKFGNDIFYIIDQENKGLAENRNILIERTETDWFMFIDSDDYLEKKALKNLTDGSESGTVDLVIGKTWREYRRKKTSWWLSNFVTKNINRYFGNNLWFMWNKLYNTKFIKSLNFKWDKGNDMLEDQIFVAHMMPRVNKIGYTKKYTYVFVQSDNSMSSVTNLLSDSKFNQIAHNFDGAIRLALNNHKFEELNKIEKKNLNYVIYNFLMQVFLAYVLYPAWYNYKKADRELGNYLFYNKKRVILIKILEKHGVKFNIPYGWWRKFTYHTLSLKSRYNIKKFKMYVKKEHADEQNIN